MKRKKAKLAIATVLTAAPSVVLAGPVLGGGAGGDRTIDVEPASVLPGGDVTLSFGPCVDGPGFEAFIDFQITGPGTGAATAGAGAAAGGVVEAEGRIRGGPSATKAHKVSKKATKGRRKATAKCRHRFLEADAKAAQVDELPVFFEYEDGSFEVVVPAPEPEPAPAPTTPPTVLGEQTLPPAPAPAPAAAPVRSQPSFTG
jgi:hypothetical protein